LIQILRPGEVDDGAVMDLNRGRSGKASGRHLHTASDAPIRSLALAYGRRFALLFAFEPMFVFDRMFEFDMFELDMFEFDIEFDGVLTVAIGVGLAMFVFIRLALLFIALLDVVSPQAAPSAPIARIAVIAIFFIKLLISCLLQSK
jgi:hypothetical protein